MSYAGYVAAAYGVFVVVLLWDYLATRLHIRRLLRTAALARARAAPRAQVQSGELQR